MPSINQLSSITTLTGGDTFPVYAGANGDTRKSSITTLQSYMQANLTFTDSTAVPEFTKQYSAPSASPFTVSVTDGGANYWLIISPTGTMANGTITLPAIANVVDLQIVQVFTTQAVTNLTIGLNGASGALGAPASLAANGYFKLQHDAATNNWYRVG